jgi:hypothetical protein
MRWRPGTRIPALASVYRGQEGHDTGVAMAKGSSGKGAAGGKFAGKGAMTSGAASRVQSAGDRNTSSATAQSGFGPRAQASGARNDGSS